jgi:hypothetical protein
VNHTSALLLFACLSIAHTWPLASAPARLSRNDNADTVLNEWAVAWIAHQAPRDPAHLFDANIFYPDRRTLAYSEPLLVPAAMGAPLLWAGASPVLVYNLLLLAGFTLTGWSGWLLVRRWTGDDAAGVLAGTLLAFNAHTMGRLPHLQAIHAEFLPLSLLALDALLRSTNERAVVSRASVGLAAAFVLQALTSIYLMVFTTVALTTSLVVRPADWRGPRARTTFGGLAVAGGLSIALVLPMLLVYKHVGVVRPLDEAAYYAATWRDYLVTPARLHYALWSHRFEGGSGSLFPGVVGSMFAIVALAAGIAWRDDRARMALAFLVAGVALSFGPSLPGYAAMYRWIPLLQAIRTVSRFGYLSLVAVAILAGFGLARMRARFAEARWLTAATLAVLVGAQVETWSAPLELVDAKQPSAVYNRLRREPAGVVAEFPFFSPDRAFHNADYMLFATRHWHPMLNGYSGIIPASYAAHYDAVRSFPDARAIDALRAIGVTHVVVHTRDLADWTDSKTAAAVRHAAGLRLIDSDGDTDLYTIAAR